MLSEAHGNLKPCGTWVLSGWWHVDNLPMHQLSLAFHLSQVFYRGMNFAAHNFILLLVLYAVSRLSRAR